MSRPPVYVTLTRAEAEASMGAAYPPTPGRPMLRLPAESGLGDGSVAVYPHDTRPGYSYYVLDGCVYEQDAGPIDEALAALVPGSVLETVPWPEGYPPHESPPWTPPPGPYASPQ